jgi:hypothetical protein
MFSGQLIQAGKVKINCKLNKIPAVSFREIAFLCIGM